MTGTGRTVVGGLSGLISVVVLVLLLRAVWLWTTTADLFYVTSAGFYAVVVAVLLIGVAWGFRRGESAEQLYMGSVGVMAVLAFLPAAYYFFTGFVLDSDPTAGAAGIGLLLTGGILLALQNGVPRVAERMNG